MKKYQRDMSGYKTDHVFKSQNKIEETQPSLTYSPLDKEVKMQHPTMSHIYNPPRWEDREMYRDTTRPQYDQRDVIIMDNR